MERGRGGGHRRRLRAVEELRRRDRVGSRRRLVSVPLCARKPITINLLEHHAESERNRSSQKRLKHWMPSTDARSRDVARCKVMPS